MECCIGLCAGVAQLVEHKLPKLGVASSNLVARSRPSKVDDWNAWFFPGYTACIVSGAGGVESGLAPLFLFLLQAVVEMSKRSPRMNAAGRMAKTQDNGAPRRGGLVGHGTFLLSSG